MGTAQARVSGQKKPSDWVRTCEFARQDVAPSCADFHKLHASALRAAGSKACMTAAHQLSQAHCLPARVASPSHTSATRAQVLLREGESSDGGEGG